MPVELVNVLAQVATLVVITATAVAAIVQLRHVRTSNQIAMLSKLHDSLQSPDFVAARRFVARDLPGILRSAEKRALLELGAPGPPEIQQAIMLGNFYENIGMFVRLGIIDRETVCELWNGLIIETWAGTAPVLALLRTAPGNFDVWVNFEYLTVLAEDWLVRHPGGSYPRGMRRQTLPDPNSFEAR